MHEDLSLGRYRVIETSKYLEEGLVMLSQCLSGQTPSVVPARLGITDEALIVANMPVLISVDGFTASHACDIAVSN